MSKEWTIRAEYKVTKEMTVTVLDNGDPMDPATWDEISSEYDVDCQLYDVVCAELGPSDE